MNNLIDINNINNKTKTKINKLKRIHNDVINITIDNTINNIVNINNNSIQKFYKTNQNILNDENKVILKFKKHQKNQDNIEKRFLKNKTVPNQYNSIYHNETIR